MKDRGKQQQLFCHVLVFVLYYATARWLWVWCEDGSLPRHYHSVLLAAREVLLFPFGGILSSEPHILQNGLYVHALQLFMAALWSLLVVRGILLVSDHIQSGKK